jgi:hypothetical protein
MQTARDDVIYALRIYNDIPAMIAEEWTTIRNCEESRNRIPIPRAAVSLDGKPVQAGRYADKTADFAVHDRSTLFQQEIDARLAHIDELRRTREWLRRGLACISEKDRYILTLAYIGPQDAAQRLAWRGKSWKEISTLVGLSVSNTRHRAYKTLDRIKAEK